MIFNTVRPMPGIVYLKLNEVAIAGLDTSSKHSAVERGTVISVGEGVTGLSAGDTVFVKTYGIDLINDEGDRYVFCNTETKSILAVVS